MMSIGFYRILSYLSGFINRLSFMLVIKGVLSTYLSNISNLLSLIMDSVTNIPSVSIEHHIVEYFNRP